MNCHEARSRLTNGTDLSEIGAHLEECPACRRFAGRMKTARQILRDHRAGVQPDAAFASRVIARLPQGSGEVLGWAVRLLPVTGLLVAVLAWFSFQTVTTTEITPTEDVAQDFLTWVLEEPETEP